MLKCPKNPETCNYFSLDVDKEFHCVMDSNIGECIYENHKMTKISEVKLIKLNIIDDLLRSFLKIKEK